MTTAATTTTTVNGVDLYVEVRGTGPRVVLVHGSWGDAGNWAEIVGRLAATHQVVSYDRRGHSRSGDGSGPGSRVQDAEDLAALIEALGPPVHVVGSSFGGSIVLTLVVARPDLVASAAVHEPPLFALLEGTRDPYVAAAMGATDDAEETVRRLLVEGEHEAAARHFVDNVAFGPGAWESFPESRRSMFATNATTYLDELEDPDAVTIDAAALAAAPVPVRITRGTASPLPLMAITDELGDLLPQAEVRIVPGTGHVPHLTHPEVFVEELRDFWAGLSR
jgi:pimeloyl-ACP methyl ester carboxylesterase